MRVGLSAVGDLTLRRKWGSNNIYSNSILIVPPGHQAQYQALLCTTPDLPCRQSLALLPGTGRLVS